MQSTFSVDVRLCDESNVFVGTSRNVPGLTLEADSLGGLLEAAFEAVPLLISQNAGVPEGAEVLVNIRVGQALPARAKPQRTRVQSSSLPKCRYVVEEARSPTDV